MARRICRHEDEESISEAIHAGAAWCEAFVNGGDLGYIRDTVKIGGEPEQRGFEGERLMPRIHRTTRIEHFCTVDAGTVRATEIGAHSWLFKHVHLGHDVVIGDNVEIATGAIVGGFVTVDDNVRIGLGAVIKPRQFIGAGAIIGMGAVVIRDVPPGATVVGNPARVIDCG